MSRKERRGPGPFGAAARPSVAGGTPVSLFAAAVAQHQAGALAEAERRYRYVLSLYPDHADSLHNLGLLALQRGDAASGVELIGKAITLNDGVGDYHYNIALGWRALNRMDAVAAHLERTVELRPDHAMAHLNLGNVRREQGRLADAAAMHSVTIGLSLTRLMQTLSSSRGRAQPSDSARNTSLRSRSFGAVNRTNLTHCANSVLASGVSLSSRPRAMA